MSTPFVAPPAGRIAPEQVVRELRHLPSAPKVLPRLKQLLSNGNAAMSDIVSLIRLDPAIAARVLQTANSAYYSRGARCFTVDDAVKRVGYSQIYDLVAYAVASQVLVRPLETYGLEPDELWRSAVTCGLAAEVLAGITGQDHDIAYTVGLLHSVGMLAIDEWVGRKHPGCRLPSRGWPHETCEAERALLAFGHEEAGAALLRHWDFPPSMSEPVRWQYSPRSSAAHLRMACLLHAAKWVRAAVGAPVRVPAMPDAWLLQPLRLEPSQLELSVAEVQTRLASINLLLEAGPAVVQEVNFPGGTRTFDRDAVRPRA